MSSSQYALFDELTELPHGFRYRPEFLTVEEEQELLGWLAGLPIEPAVYRSYTARRRVVGYGESGDSPEVRMDNVRHRTVPGLPTFLQDCRRKVAVWLNMDESSFSHALCTEYPPSASIGWHSDAPQFDTVVGLSLAGSATMRFRPYAALDDARRQCRIRLEPRSAYVLQGDVRWRWQHQIPPARVLRYSITFRTVRSEKVAPRRQR